MSEEFQQQVVQRLTAIETHLEGLVGNGQPGRMDKLERKVSLHEKVLWTCWGGALVVGYVIRGLFGQ